jgi:hypothetical protein
MYYYLGGIFYYRCYWPVGNVMDSLNDILEGTRHPEREK